MDVEIPRDVASLDPELLQLPEVSPLALKESPHIAEELYSQWLSLPDTVRLVPTLCLGLLVSTHIFNDVEFML